MFDCFRLRFYAVEVSLGSLMRVPSDDHILVALLDCGFESAIMPLHQVFDVDDNIHVGD